MRRDCCDIGFIHLRCIENRDLEQCHACQKDPMEEWIEGKGGPRLRPFCQANVESASELCATADTSPVPAKRSLDSWKETVLSALQEMTSLWTQKINVSDIRVTATLLDGRMLVNKKQMPYHNGRSHSAIREMLTDVVCETLVCWTGLESSYGRLFDSAKNESCRRDTIVEVTIQFICTQWTRLAFSTLDARRPFETGTFYHRLGKWRCFLCLSGLTRASLTPKAKRAIVKKV